MASRLTSLLCRLRFWHRYSVLEKIPVLQEASRHWEAAVFARSSDSIDPIDSWTFNQKRRCLNTCLGFIDLAIRISHRTNSHGSERYVVFNIQFYWFVCVLFLLHVLPTVVWMKVMKVVLWMQVFMHASNDRMFLFIVDVW